MTPSLMQTLQIVKFRKAVFNGILEVNRIAFAVLVGRERAHKRSIRLRFLPSSRRTAEVALAGSDSDFALTTRQNSLTT